MFRAFHNVSHKSVLILALSLWATSGWCQSEPAPDAPLLEVKRFVVEGENPLSESETDAILAPYLGIHKSLETLEDAAKALEKQLRTMGYTFHLVIVPAQRPADGVIKLSIVRFSLAEITVTGNQHFSKENILRTLPSLKAGELPADVRMLAREVGLANEHPAKRIAINIKESRTPDHLDAEVRVKDVPAVQTFVGLTGGTRDHDDTINRNTGYTRLTVGHQRSNLFDLDHALTLAYTTSPDHPDRVTQIGAFYWIPLYGYHTTLSAYYTKSDVNSGSVGLGGQSLDISGSGEFFGLRATYILPRLQDISHNLSLALDDRYFKSEVGLGGIPLPANIVRSRPLSLRYTVKAEQADRGIGGYAEYISNLSGGSANDDTAYAIARVGAVQSWEAYRYGIDANIAFGGGWSLSGKLRGQHSDKALIAGEQFGLGGIGSVRGLRDRESSGDRGYTLNLEVQAPQVAPGLAPYAFYDMGYRAYTVPVPAVSNSEGVASVGLGARWNWEKRFELNAAYANVLNGIAGGTQSGHGKLHFSLFYRF